MPEVILEEVSVHGYRSCENTVFRPHTRLSALIGINGAGKTNILNAIRLLDPDCLPRYRNSKNDSSPTDTSIYAVFRVGTRKVNLRLLLALSSGRAGDEIVDYTEEWDFSSGNKKKSWVEIPSFLFVGSEQVRAIDLKVFFFDRSRGKNARRTQMDGAEKALAILENEEILELVRAVVKFRSSIKYYGASQFTDPSKCPSSFEIDGDGKIETPYSRPPSSHLRFLFDLYSLKKNNLSLYNEYENFVSTKQLGLISRLSWKAVRLSSYTAEVKTGGEVNKVRQYKTLIIPKVQIGSSHITFNQLSEGTFKTLALIFYVMTERSSCLLVEEPEVCVHYGLLRRIISTIKSHSRYKQVAFSTHSDLVLDSLETENIFVVEMKRSQTRVSNLEAWAGPKGMAAINAYLEETGTLGEYWRSGGLSS